MFAMPKRAINHFRLVIDWLIDGLIDQVIDWLIVLHFQIIETVEFEHVFNLNIAALESILLEPSIADKPVAVVSITGAFRKGKSFMLNFFLRYLSSIVRWLIDWLINNLQESSSSAEETWLGDDINKLDGFSWRGGAERDTNGILLWPHPFLLKRPDGSEIVVLLMDTQGAFDSQSTVKGTVVIE